MPVPIYCMRHHVHRGTRTNTKQHSASPPGTYAPTKRQRTETTMFSFVAFLTMCPELLHCHPAPDKKVGLVPYEKDQSRVDHTGNGFAPCFLTGLNRASNSQRPRWYDRQRHQSTHNSSVSDTCIRLHTTCANTYDRV